MSNAYHIISWVVNLMCSFAGYNSAHHRYVRK